MTLPSYADPPFAVAPEPVVLHFSVKPMSLNNYYLNASGRGRILSPEAKAWRTEAGYQLNKQHPSHVTGRVFIDLAVEDSGQGDIDNKIKCVLDLLVGHGVIEQDHRNIVRGVNAYWDASITGCRVTVRAVA